MFSAGLCLVSNGAQQYHVGLFPVLESGRMFHGSIVALVTPMRVDGSVDDESLDRLVEFHVENKTDAIV